MKEGRNEWTKERNQERNMITRYYDSTIYEALRNRRYNHKLLGNNEKRQKQRERNREKRLNDHEGL